MEEFSQSPSKTVLLATITSKSDYSEKYFGLNIDFTKMCLEIFYCQFQFICMVLLFSIFAY